MRRLMSGLRAQSLRIAIHYNISDEYLDQWLSAQLDVARAVPETNAYHRAVAWEENVRQNIIDGCLRASGIDEMAGAPVFPES